MVLEKDFKRERIDLNFKKSLFEITAHLNGLKNFFKEVNFKIVESLSNYGFYPEDFYKTLKDKRKYLAQSQKMILGIRSAGSYFAPAVALALKVFSYDSIRNKREFKKNKNLTKRVTAHSCLFLVDEGPGTGKSFNEIINEIKKINPIIKIVIIHTRKLPEFLKDYSNILIKNDYFTKLCKSKIKEQITTIYLRKNNQVISINFKKINSANLNYEKCLSLKTYESPKFLIRVKLKKDGNIFYKNLLIKFLGYSLIGISRFNKLKIIKKFHPKILFFLDGALVMEFLDSKKELEVNNLDYNQIVEYFLSFSKVSVKNEVSYKDYIKFFLEILKNDFGIKFKRLPKKFRNSIKHLLNIVGSKKCFLIEPDWKLEMGKWFLSENSIHKLDNFNCRDYCDWPMADELIQLSGFIIEFDLDKYQEKKLLRSYFELSKEKLLPGEILLNKLIYLVFKLDYYRYIKKNLFKQAYNIKYVKRHICFLERKMIECYNEITSIPEME